MEFKYTVNVDLRYSDLDECYILECFTLLIAFQKKASVCSLFILTLDYSIWSILSLSSMEDVIKDRKMYLLQLV